MDTTPSRQEDEHSWDSDFAPEQTDAPTERRAEPALESEPPEVQAEHADAGSKQRPALTWLADVMATLGNVGVAYVGVVLLFAIGVVWLVVRDDGHLAPSGESRVADDQPGGAPHPQQPALFEPLTPVPKVDGAPGADLAPSVSAPQTAPTDSPLST